MLIVYRQCIGSDRDFGTIKTPGMFIAAAACIPKTESPTLTTTILTIVVVSVDRSRSNRKPEVYRWYTTGSDRYPRLKFFKGDWHGLLRP